MAGKGSVPYDRQEQAKELQRDIIMEDPVDMAVRSAALIESGDLQGAGNVLSIDADKVTVITASHVIADEEDIYVTLFGGMRCKAEARSNDTDRDCCFLTVHPEAGLSSVTGIESAKELPSAGDYVFMVLPFSPGSDTIGTVGLMEEDEEVLAYAGIVKDPDIYSEDLTQNVILCDIDVTEGMSGSGLFDENGRYLGLLIGGTGDHQGVFLPADSIVR